LGYRDLATFPHVTVESPGRGECSGSHSGAAPVLPVHTAVTGRPSPH